MGIAKNPSLVGQEKVGPEGSVVVTVLVGRDVVIVVIAVEEAVVVTAISN